MRLGRRRSAVAAALTAALLAGCTEDAPPHAALPDVIPLDDPCGWLTIQEATELLAAAGEVRTDEVGALPDPRGLDDQEQASCRYGWGGQAPAVTVGVRNIESLSSVVREQVEDLEADPEAGGTRARLVTITGISAMTNGEFSALDHTTCVVNIPTEGRGLLGVGISVRSGSERRPVCESASAAAETVVRRLVRDTQR